MSPFPVRHQKQPEPTRVRLWVEPIAIGGAVEGVVAGLAFVIGGNSVFLPLLLPGLALVLGWRYGFLRGSVAAGLPFALLVVAELIRSWAGGSGGAGTIATLLIGGFVILVLTFCTFIASRMRGRYRPNPVESDAPTDPAPAPTRPW